MEPNEKLAEKLDDIKDRLIVIETKMTMINGVEKDSTEALQSTRSAHKRLDGIEGNITWLWRTVVGGLILATITFLLNYK
ncbi:hemolysin XhlA [Bacillus sp. AFS002410]|uniref:hemolysin XhlA family protein n=1 Tax=Bacillus sp. AFS002410 TaxID=2033481 RepID=UPI000BF21697|nr:hemolysin XhlA family protein [Bacillus sp. AFS002410]PEJ57387.1 hemolysin XhlA [Bacillus sp. AFS002410]